MSSIWTARRSVTDRKLSGLAGGIARLWNVDPILVRVAFCVLALSGGIGVVIYLAGWLMVPSDDRERSVLDDAIPQTRSWPRELRIGIVAVVCLIGVATLSSVAPFGFAAAIVMAAVWYFGYYRNRRPATDRPAQSADAFRFAEFSGEPTPFSEAATAWQQRMREYAETINADADARAWAAHESSRRAAASDQQYAYRDSPGASSYPDQSFSAAEATHAAYLTHPDPVGLYTEPAPDDSAIQLAAERRWLRRRSARRLGLVSTIVLGLTICGLAVANHLGWIHATVPVYLSSALLVLGLTLLAGTRFGRPPGLPFLAVLLSLVTIASLFGGVRANLGDAQVGVRTLSYHSAAQLPAADHQRSGQLTVDLSELNLTQNLTYTATVDQGRLIVILPSEDAAKINYRVQQGMAQLPETEIQVGEQLTGNATWSAAATAGEPTITLDLRVQQGQLEVRS